MFNGLWAKKIGMSEVFQGDLVLPVTVVDVSHWYILQLKTVENDGYAAAKVGCLRFKYQATGFDSGYLKNLSKHFEHIKEVRLLAGSDLSVGQEVDFSAVLNEGQEVDVVGTTSGAGFTGVVKRHNFGGGNASHGGSNMMRAPGSISFMRRQGRIIKGKRMAGHMGATRSTVKNLEVVKIDTAAKSILVSGSIPGRSGSLVFVRKCKQV